jgi:hypothetical protein
MARVGPQRHRKKNNSNIILYYNYAHNCEHWQRRDHIGPGCKELTVAWCFLLCVFRILLFLHRSHSGSQVQFVSPTEAFMFRHSRTDVLVATKSSGADRRLRLPVNQRFSGRRVSLSAGSSPSLCMHVYLRESARVPYTAVLGMRTLEFGAGLISATAETGQNSGEVCVTCLASIPVESRSCSRNLSLTT